MKRFTVIILSLLLFFNSSLFIIIYSLKTLELSQNTKSKIQLLRSGELCSIELNPDVTVFRFSLNDPPASRHLQMINDDEILYNGYYFDIICEKETDDSIYIYCIQDYEEDEMLCALILHMEKEETKKKELQYFNILFSFLSNAINYNCNYEFPLFYQLNLHVKNNVNFYCGILDIPTPPPRISV